MGEMVHLEENYIRRERRRKQETKQAIGKMRAALPVYNLDQIREYKLPYHEALLISMNEKGFICSAEFLKQLLEFQCTMRAKAGPQSVLWTRPQLIENRNELKILSDGLLVSEKYYIAENYARQCEEFLKLAVYFAFLSADWWWLGEQLLVQSVTVTTEYTFLGGKYQALSRFAYAKFLIENAKDYESATEHLKTVRELSNGTKWNTHLIFPQQKDILFLQTSYLLHICLIREAQYLIKLMDYESAAKLAVQARKRAAEACFHNGETKALLAKGICEMNLKDAKSAIKSFNKAFYIQLRLDNQEGICEARIQLAKAYLMAGNTSLSMKTLMLLREAAAKYNLPFYLAQAYWQLGEFYLNNGQPQKATPLLAEALTLFHEGDNVKESEQVRVLAAISAGLELFPKFLILLSRTDEPNTGMCNLLKLIDWKDSRKQFWDEGEEPSTESSSLETIITESSPEISKKIEEYVDGSLAEEEEGDDDNAIIELHVNVNSFDETSSTAIDNEEKTIENDEMF